MMRRASYEAKRGNEEDESEMERLAILAAQAYRNRWQVERPRKPPEKEPDQLEFAFPDAA